MLVIMSKKARHFSIGIAAFGLLPIAAALGQTQDKQQKTGAAMSDPTPVTLSMKWARGDAYYGPNFISLSTPCQASDNVPCECTMAFKGVKSQGFADYISSFRDALVPVVYQVLYGSDGLAHARRLESVGSWQADKFPKNDRLLGTQFTFKGGKPGQRQTANIHDPADCFPPKGN
jgi:hypothetical protein